MIEIDLNFLKLICLVMLEHGQKIINIAIIPKFLMRLILILKKNSKLRHIFFHLLYVNLLNIFEKLIYG